MKTVSTRHTIRGLLLVAGLCVSGPALSEGSVRILSPANGAKLDIMDQNRLEYDVVPGPRGDHVHVYVNDKEVGILRQLKGSYTFESLPEGEPTVCIKVVNKAHVPIGLEHCVQVSVG